MVEKVQKVNAAFLAQITKLQAILVRIRERIADQVHPVRREAKKKLAAAWKLAHELDDMVKKSKGLPTK